MWKAARIWRKVRPNSAPNCCGRVALWKGKVGKVGVGCHPPVLADEPNGDTHAEVVRAVGLIGLDLGLDPLGLFHGISRIDR
jgi:hypothetical protein